VHGVRARHLAVGGQELQLQLQVGEGCRVDEVAELLPTEQLREEGPVQ
jgi:hypothetical protein